MTQVEDVPTHSTELAPREAIEWVRTNQITLVAIALIVAQLWLKGVVLGHAYFRQDDYQVFDRALASHLDWRYLMTVYNGHMTPGAMAVAWMLARLSLYDWVLTSSVTIVFLAASSVALLRLLRTLFGNRPAILIPFVVYLFTPLMLTGLTFWTNTLLWLPTQLVIFMALNAHIVYIRGGQFWHAIVATVWLAVGMLFDDAGVLVPLLIFALTTAFFSSGRWPQAALAVLRKYWRAWVLYGALAVGYAVVFFHQLPTSNQQPIKPGQFSNVLSFVSVLTRVSFIPGALGGPWRWLSLGDLAFAAELPILTYLAWVVAAVIVGASLWYRRRAERAWVILAAWVFVTAIAPLVIGRVGLASATLLGADLHYLADSLPVLAICLGLAFWPVTEEESAYRSHPPARPRRLGTAAVLVVFSVGSLWSYHAYEADTSSAASRSYIATARAAVAGAPQGAVIFDTPTPTDIEVAALFGRYAYTSQVIGPLANALPVKHLRWTSAPSGAIANLMIFDDNGRLWRVLLLGRAGAPPAADHGCWRVGYRPVRLQIPGISPLYVWPWTLDLTYSGQSAALAVEFGGRWHDEALPAGQHDVYVPALGGGSSITVQLIGGGPSVCLTHLSIGNPVPSILSKPIPAVPVPG